MDNPIPTSFIPKQASTGTTRPVASMPSAASSGGSLLTTLSLVVLFLSLLFTGGAYAYKMYLLNVIYQTCQVDSDIQPNTDQLINESTITKKCGLYKALEQDRIALSSSLLTEMQRLDAKLKAADTVNKSHFTLIPLFDLLSTTTLKTVRFTKFEMKGEEVSLDGTSRAYEDIAVQSNKLNEIKQIKNPTFYDLNLDSKGNVIFKLKFSVDPTLLDYMKNSVSSLANRPSE